MPKNKVYVSGVITVGAILLGVTVYHRSLMNFSVYSVYRPLLPVQDGISNSFTASPTSGNTVPRLDGMYIVEVFPLLQTNSWKAQGYNISDTTLVKKREMEYFEALSSNLQHPFVSQIHLLTDQPDVLLRKLTAEYNVDRTKIHIHQTVSNPTYRDVFKYASDSLQHKLVFILNADNMLGRGFDNINTGLFKGRRNIMYALTRHRHPRICGLNPTGYCDGDSYIGSHDGFLFYMGKLLPEVFLSELNFSSNSYGSENVIIWASRRYLKTKVTNPCKRLVLYHNHCSKVRPRNVDRKRVNIKGKSGTARYSF